MDRAHGEVRNGRPQGEGRLVGIVGTNAVGEVDDPDARVPLDDGALEGSGVGLLTGTKSIVGGIAIATMPILAQYLQENATR